MAAIPVVLDSTVYKHSPQLDTELFRFFRKQCRVGIACLYVPMVVEQEYLTWIEEEVSYATNRIDEAIHSLNRLMPSKDFFGVDFVNYLAGSELKDRQSKAIANWDAFKSDTRAVLVPISQDDGAKVMRDYLSGAKPFRKRKSREDIPDAFIRLTVLRLLRKEGIIYLVTQDKKFAESFSDIAKVRVSYDLSLFLQLPDIASQTGLVFESDAIESAKRMLNYYKDEFQEMIAKAISDEIDSEFVAQQFYESFMDEPTTFSSVEVATFQLDEGSISELSERTLLIPLEAEIVAEVAYGLEAGDLHRLGKSRLEKLVNREERDPGYYDINEAFPVKVKGTVSMRYAGTDPKTWDDVKKYVQFRVETYDFVWI
jgi:hypothetical protein